MTRHLFGWDYPPGAENDPNAPWNQKDPPECVSCGDALGENCTRGCAKHGGPVCDSCRCPDCPEQSPTVEEREDTEPEVERE